MTLNRKVYRSALKKFSFFMVTSFLTLIAVTMLAGALTTARTMEIKTEEIYGNLNVEDAQFVPDREISEEDLLRYESEYDMIMEAQYYTDITSGDNTIRIFKDNGEVNLTWIFEKDGGTNEYATRFTPDYGKIYICRDYALNNNLNIGDELIAGDDRFIIGGYALRPDYLNTLKDLTESLGDYYHFTTGIVSAEYYDEIISSDTSLTNNLYYSVIFNDSSLSNDFRQELYKDYRPVEYISSYSNNRIELMRSTSAMLKGEFSSYSSILFVLVMIIIAFMLSRIINSESRNIGTLKALGYKDRELITHYVLYALIPTFAGGLLGVIATIPFAQAFSTYFFNDMDSFPYTVSYNVAFLLAAVLIPLVFNCLIAAVVTARCLRKDAYSLMKNNKGIRNTRLLFRTSALRFKTIYMLRVLIGNPVRTLVFIIGMTVASIIILLGGMCQDSQRNVLEKVLPDMMGNARYETGLKTFHTGTVEDGETLIDVMFEVPGTNVGFNLIGYDEDNILLKRESVSGAPLTYGEYYMTSGAASYYGVTAGNDFTFIHRITGEEWTVHISDIIDNNALRLIITSKENAARIVGISPDEYNNILSVEPLNVPSDQILKVADFDSYKDSFSQMLSATKVVYNVLLTVGIIVCILIVNLLSGMIIDENGRNISMLKVLGYHDREIRDIILRPNHMLLPCCYLLSIPLTVFMTKLMMSNSVENSGVFIDVVVKPSTLILYFLIVAGSYLVSLYFGNRKLDKVDMAESLKQED
ncbi:MAG: ABC transporter permease [Clostridiales bacterium]|nr:ABC transporter permease [Clostridiales bacterium]